MSESNYSISKLESILKKGCIFESDTVERERERASESEREEDGSRKVNKYNFKPQ